MKRLRAREDETAKVGGSLFSGENQKCTAGSAFLKKECIAAAKAAYMADLNGAAEAAPFQSTICNPSSINSLDEANAGNSIYGQIY